MTAQPMTAGPSIRYKTRARWHWARCRMSEVAQLADPAEFFAEIGRQAEERIDQLATNPTR